MGRFLTGAGEVPDLALSSPAVRAERTLELAVRSGGWNCQVEVRPALYGDRDDVLGVVRSVPDSFSSVLLVGHEPAWSTLACLLTGANEIRLPTASMLRLVLELGRWRDVGAGTARIEWLVIPRLLEVSQPTDPS
jgi:phosphohistidine phosphatase